MNYFGIIDRVLVDLVRLLLIVSFVGDWVYCDHLKPFLSHNTRSVIAVLIVWHVYHQLSVTIRSLLLNSHIIFHWFLIVQSLAPYHMIFHSIDNLIIYSYHLIWMRLLTCMKCFLRCGRHQFSLIKVLLATLSVQYNCIFSNKLDVRDLLLFLTIDNLNIFLLESIFLFF